MYKGSVMSVCLSVAVTVQFALCPFCVTSADHTMVWDPAVWDLYLQTVLQHIFPLNSAVPAATNFTMSAVDFLITNVINAEELRYLIQCHYIIYKALCLLKVIKTGLQTAGRLSLQWPPTVLLNETRPLRDWIHFVLRSKAVEASAKLVAITNSWMLIDSSTSCESQISNCLSSCQHEEKQAVSVEVLFWNVGDGQSLDVRWQNGSAVRGQSLDVRWQSGSAVSGQSLDVQWQSGSTVSSCLNPLKVIGTFWLHFRTSHLGMKFFEDLNALGCDAVWVCECLLTF